MLNRLKNIGPGMLVAAAFIGPGTITTATIAGAQFGYSLLWAVAFSTVATIILQLMTVRIGMIARLGVGEALRVKTQSNKALRVIIFFLVVSAVFIGNSAYEAGNITGAILGFSDSFNKYTLIAIIVIIAFLLLYSGSYKIIEKVLIGLVSLMGVVFLISALALKPDFSEIFNSLVIPSVPENSELLIVGLIGTTIVPYNLFLHASSVKKKWRSIEELKYARIDAIISIALGGIITMAVVVCAATAMSNQSKSIEGMNDLANQLEPILGSWSKSFMSLGFLAAGLSSTITAPLAASYAITEIRGREINLQAANFKLTWSSVLIFGAVVACIDYKPTFIILFAQITNGLILPITVFFLLWMTNDKKLMKGQSNSFISNLLGFIILVITIGLGAKGILSAFDII